MRLILSGFSVVLIACGGGGGKAQIDSHINLIDAGNPPPPAGCDYGELHDGTNDDLSTNASGTPEQTLLTYTSGTMVICGNIDMTHYVAGTGGDEGTIDADVYDISIGADSELRVDLTGAGAEALDDVEIVVNDTSGNGFGDGVFLANHGVVDVFLPAGTYEFAMFAGSATAPTSMTAIPYKIKIQTYDIESACTKVTATANHTEGVANNDVFAISYGNAANPNGFFQLITPSTATGVAEPSGITLAPATGASIAGTLAASGAAIDGDDYLDRDTYTFTTGASVNEVTIRVDWPDMTDDLDFYTTDVTTTMPANGIFSYIAGTADSGVGTAGTGGPEIGISAAEPSTTYWVWVGGYMGSTTMPETYTISFCPANFTP